LAINLHQRESAVLKWPRASGRRVDSYQITAPSLDSSVALLNGRPMIISHTQGRFEPQPGRFEGSYALQPASYSFLVIDVEAAACMPSGK
jgi:hypothetical protein